MMPVGAGGGGFLRGRPAKPPSSRGSPPPGPARGRAGGRGRKWPGGRARPRRPPGGQVGAAPGLSARAGRGTGAQGRGRRPGPRRGSRRAPHPRRPLGRGSALPADPPKLGAAREGKPVVAGGPTGGVVWRPLGFGVSRRPRGPPPAVRWARVRSARRGLPVRRSHAGRPTDLRSPSFPGWEILLHLGIYPGDGRGGPSWEPLARGSGAAAVRVPRPAVAVLRRCSEVGPRRCRLCPVLQDALCRGVGPSLHLRPGSRGAPLGRWTAGLRKGGGTAGARRDALPS